MGEFVLENTWESFDEARQRGMTIEEITKEYTKTPLTQQDIEELCKDIKDFMESRGKKKQKTELGKSKPKYKPTKLADIHTAFPPKKRINTSCLMKVLFKITTTNL